MPIAAQWYRPALSIKMARFYSELGKIVITSEKELT